MARTLSHKIVSSKMDILMEQRNYLQTFVDETNEVLQLATSWLRNEEDITNSFKSTDINKMIDDKLAFLVGTDFSVGCEKITGEQESVATRSFPAASKSIDQPFPAGPGHVSGVSVASNEIKTIMNQVKVMQDAMSFLSTSSEKLSEKQLATDMFVESLSDKYSKIEQKKIEEIEIELKSICEKQKKVAKQQDKRMTSFENKIQSVTGSQSDIIENCYQQQSKIKDYNKENERLQTQSQQMTQDLSDVRENIQKLNSRISVLENQAVTNTQLEALVNRVEFLETSSEVMLAKFEEHGSSLEEFTTKTEETLKELSAKIEEQGSSLEEFTTITEETLKGLLAKFEEHGTSLEEFTRRTEETLKDLPSVRGKEFEQLEKFEEKISALEKSWNETSQNSYNLCYYFQFDYEMVCQVVADRLVPLERLRDVFNEKMDIRNKNMKMLDSVSEQMAVLQSKFSQLEIQTQRQVIGFSAYRSNSLNSATDTNITSLSDTISNNGNHFDPSTRVFTAPLDGLYAAFLSVQIVEDFYTEIVIRKRPCFCFGENNLCKECVVSRVVREQGSDKYLSTFVLVNMKAGNVLGVEIYGIPYGKVGPIFDTMFSCFKIN